MNITSQKPGQYDEIVGSLRSSTPEETAAANRQEFQRAAIEHADFLAYFERGVCYLCHAGIPVFDEANPCVHWLLNPKGFRKRHFPEVFARFGYYELQAYLRWVASVEAACRDINDLVGEHSGKKKIDLTIRWSKLEWSFSCSASDMRGHGKPIGSQPHYHFQMASNGKVIIKYNDFHVPFSEDDLRMLYLTEHHPEFARHEFAFGNGMQELMAQSAERLVKGARPTSDSDSATLHIQTIIRARTPNGIAGEDLRAIIDEARQKGVTLASLAHKLGGNTLTIIEPGPGVPSPRERRPRGRRR